jgi:hypothetical protein
MEQEAKALREQLNKLRSELSTVSDKNRFNYYYSNLDYGFDQKAKR